MTENTSDRRNVRDDEIDLLDLFNRMGRSISKGLNALWRAFLISVVFTVRRWLPLTISIVLGIGVSYITMKNTSSMYTSEMVLRNNAVNNALLISYINRLNDLDNNSLAKKLNIPLETGKNIGEIRAFWIIDKNKDKMPDFVDYTNSHDIYDTTNIRMNDRVDIRLNIMELQNLGIVRDGIIWCIENDSSFTHMNRLRLRLNKDMLERIKTDIRNIDSLQKTKYLDEVNSRMSRSDGRIIFMQEEETQKVYKYIHELFSKKQKYEEEADLYSRTVTLISDFTIPSRRLNGLSYYAKKNVPFFFATMLLITIIIHNKGKLKEVYNKY